MKSFKIISILSVMVLSLLFAPSVYSAEASDPKAAEAEAAGKELTPEQRRAKAKEIAEDIARERAGAAEKYEKDVDAARIIVRNALPVIKMVSIPGGCFQMGDSTGLGDDDERPLHEVCLEDYYIGETEVTQELWGIVLGDNPVPKGGRSPQRPVTKISWQMANRFIHQLNVITERFYRLPTEAEWEYAAREGGRDMIWSGTNDESKLGRYAWFIDNSEERFHDVKTKRPNALGVYDMSGNALEWVEDRFDFDYYQTSPVNDPYGPDFSMWMSVRGGSVLSGAHRVRTTSRYALEGVLRDVRIGFRLAE